MVGSASNVVVAVVLKLGKIPLFEDRKVGRIYRMSISCFLIDMKYISKFLKILFMQL